MTLALKVAVILAMLVDAIFLFVGIVMKPRPGVHPATRGVIIGHSILHIVVNIVALRALWITP